jgi:pimeloyl-ACP methyl ester carboxylesterase
MTKIGSRTGQQIPVELVQLESKARRIETAHVGGSMVWRVWGSGEPLVLVHGSHGCWTHWVRNIEALSQDRMVIAADLPGHGDSSSPPEESHEAMSAALATGLKQILEQTGHAADKADIAGFSFGGVIAAFFALWNPDLVRRLFVIGVGGIGTPHGKVRLGRVGGLVGEDRRNAMKANLLGLMLHHPDTVDDLAMHLLVANAAKARIRKIAEFVVPDKLLAVLPELKMPVEALWGEFDRPHPIPHEQEEVLRRYQPDMDFRVIEGAGHWAMYERPDAFNRALLAMLAAPVRAMPKQSQRNSAA